MLVRRWRLRCGTSGSLMNNQRQWAYILGSVSGKLFFSEYTILNHEAILPDQAELDD